MGLCCCTCSRKKSKKNYLQNAQKMTITEKGEQISTRINTQFLTFKELEDKRKQMINNGNETANLFHQPYNQLSQINDNLYLSGVGAIYEENITSKNIKCLIEVTFEGATYKVKGIQFYRIPVSFVTLHLLKSQGLETIMA